MQWLDLEAALAAAPPGTRVLEVGTGQGSMFRYLSGLVARRPACSLVTLDLDPSAVNRARTYLQDGPPGLRDRITALHADLVEWAPSNRDAFNLVVASAVLSAVPLARPFGIEEVLEALRLVLMGGGWLYLEDYLPLPPPGPPTDPERVASSLWRWHKALAQLAGRPHHIEWPPSWVAARLKEQGFVDVHWVTDERPDVRSEECWEALLSDAGPARPPELDRGLWLAMDRYRRELCRKIGQLGLVQWSGSYRLKARKL